MAALWSRYRRIVAWSRQPSSRLPLAIVVTALVLASAVGLIAARQRADRIEQGLPVSPPRPGAATAPASAGQVTPGRSGTPPVQRGRFRCAATPAGHGSTAPSRICLPSIRVDAKVMRLGLNADRTVEVPPLSHVGDAGWYRYSAAPGAVGPTVILGHVDSARYGEGVFFRLGRLHRGDRITVSRSDGKIATFVVTRVLEVSKRRFPTQDVYGATSGPAIRLVTCGGRFDAATGNYLDNIIAFGTLVSLR